MNSFQAATLAFAKATRGILQRAPHGLSAAELRALNDGVEGIEKSLTSGDPAPAKPVKA